MRALLRYLVLHPIAFVLGVLVILLLSLAFLIFTKAGTQAFVKASQSFVPALEMEGVSGVLGRELQIEKLHWEEQGTSIAIEGAKLDSKLALSQVEFRQLELDKLVIRIPSSDSTAPAVMPDIPLPIDLNVPNAKVGRLEVWSGQTLTAFDDIDLSAYSQNNVLTIDSLSASPQWWQGDTRFHASGQWDLIREHATDLKLVAKANESDLGRGELTADLTGSLDKYDLILDGQWQYQGYPEYSVDGVATGSLNDLVVDSLQLTSDMGALETAGKLSWLNGTTLELSNSLQELDIAYIDSKLSSLLNTKFQLKSDLDASWQINIDELDGFFQEYHVKAQGDIAWIDGVPSVGQLEVAAGDNELKVEGKDTEDLTLEWILNAKNLAQLDERLKGKLKGKGVLHGKLDASQLSLSIHQLTGKIQDYPIQAKGELGKSGDQLSAKDVVLDVGDNHLQLDGAAQDELGVTWRLDAKNLKQLSPKLSGRLRGDGKLSGLLDASHLNLSINQLSGRVQDFPVKAKGSIKLKDKAFSSKDFILDVGKNRLTLNGSAAETVGVDWVLNARNLKQLSPKLSGALKGKGNLKGLLDGSRLNLQIAELSGKVKQFPVKAKGQIRLRGDVVSARDFAVNVGKNRLLLNGDAKDDLGLTWQLDAKQLTQLSLKLKGRLKGTGELRGRLDGSQFDLNVQQLSGRLQNYPIQAKGRVRLEGEKVNAKNFVVNVGKNRLVLNGDATDSQGLSWSLDAKRLRELLPQLKGQVKGNGNLRGLLDGSRLDLRIAALNGKIQNYPLTAKGLIRFKDQQFSARDLMVQVGQNQLTLNGSARDQLGVNWALNARNLSQLSRELKGNVKGQGTLSGALDGSKLALAIQSLEGTLQGFPLTAKGQILRRQEQLQAKDLRIRLGQNQATLNGQLSEPFNITWQVDAKQLAQVHKELSGYLKGQGSLKGNLKRPIVVGDLQGSQLRYQDLLIQQINASIQSHAGQYVLAANVKGIQQGNTRIAQANLEGQGTLQKHSLRLRAQHPDVQLDIRAHGGWVQDRWRGQIAQLSAQNTPAGNWRLARPTQLTLSKQGIQGSEACLSNGQGLVCVTPKVQSGVTQLTGRMQRMPLSILGSKIPSNIRLAGVATADFDVQLAGKRRSGRMTLRLPDNTVQIQRASGQPEVLRYSGVIVHAQLQGNRINLRGQGAIHGRGNLQLDGNINLADSGQHRIDMRTTLTASSIAWLQRFIPQIDGLKGRITGDIRVNGLLSKPNIVGTARLQGGQVYVPETGVSFNNINLNLQSTGNQQIAISGGLQAGGGQLKVSGVARLANLPKWQANIRLQGNNLLVMDTHEVRSWVSPDLTIKAESNNIAISGIVRVPRTIISLRELPPSAKVRSDDVVIVGRRAKQYQQLQAKGARLTGKGRPRLNEPEKPINIVPNVVVELGRQVEFSGFGLEANLAGRIRVLRSRREVIGEGSLNVVNGVYKAYGQNLTIERGRLIFTGAIDNPGIDLRAVRVVDNGDIKVGMALGGTVQVPESSLFSNPPQRQSDTLSYLLTGRSVSTLSGSDTALLQQAITSFGIAGGEGIAQQLGSAIGLDEVGLTSRGGDYKQSELLLGKRLGPRLYVKYIVGLFDSLQRVAVNYKINKNVELEAQSGENHGVDFIYKIDTNRGPLK